MDNDKSFFEELKLIKLTSVDSEYFKILETVFYNWWGKQEGFSMDKVHEYLMSFVKKNDNPNNINNIPEIYVATYRDEFVGTFGFSMNDIETKQDLYPWLVNLYVDEDYRRMKVSGYLIRQAIKKAKEKNLKALYLYTHHEDMYEKYGFKFVDLINTYDGKNPYQRLYKLDMRDIEL